MAPPEGCVTPAPPGWEASEAATLPLAGMVSPQAIRALGLTQGQALLINGGRGAMESAAVELAAHQWRPWCGGSAAVKLAAHHWRPWRVVGSAAAQLAAQGGIEAVLPERGGLRVADGDGALDVVGGAYARKTFA